ncbi:MAG: polyprenyl synthetase family protein [Anaerolineales bacterium]|nr:polyprenyl synthetase family protein [Anaerolineales bacterium]
MDMEEVKAQVLGLPEVAAWPEMVRIFEQHVPKPHQVWEWPYRACRAVGGEDSLASSSAAAILCMILSILLVDDMLDQDPRGIHLQLGDAAAANISFAFQSASFRMLAGTPVDAERRATVMRAFADMGLTMAFGQDLDVRNLSGEENYWKVTHAKSSSYFGTAFFAGAVMGNADSDTAARIRKLGELMGDVVQIHDDIKDALDTPANPDWKQMRNNLLFLFARTADHPDRERFLALQPQVDDPEALKEAQRILVRSGAVSYGMYHICHRYQACMGILNETPLKDPEPLKEVVVKFIYPLTEILHRTGIPIPPELQTV